MMIKIILFFYFFVFHFSALACEVHLPSHLVTLSDNVNLHDVMAHSDCSQKTLEAVNQTLMEIDGKISNFRFEEILKSKNEFVLIRPSQIKINHFKNLVREQVTLPVGVHMGGHKTVNGNNFLTLEPGDQISVECIDCVFGLNQVLLLKTSGIDGKNSLVPITADFRKMVKAYRISGFLPAFSEIVRHSLTEEYIESIPHTDLVTNIETLKYFKTNKPIKAGELLRQSDLNAINLVRAGVKTEVIIENELLKLKTSGISRSNGSLGQFVEVFHQQKNEKYQGKVIDINKVLVEL